MNLTHTASYDAPPDAVLAMLLDPAFRDEVCSSQRALEHSVDVRESGGVTSVEIRRTQSMEGAPAAAVKLTGSTVRIVQREMWTSPRDAELSIATPGRPGHLRGTITLRDSALGCDELVTGEVKVGIPLVGGKLERLIGDVLVHGLRREAAVGATWLGRRA
jgi:hypothetical protein